MLWIEQVLYMHVCIVISMFRYTRVVPRFNTVKSPILDDIWVEHVFISEEGPHLQADFVRLSRAVPNSNMLSGSIPIPLDHLLSGHVCRATGVRLQMSSRGRDGCVLGVQFGWDMT